ncbi:MULTISPECIES: MBOAT family O-acyltransferase [Methylobacterium]|jgi:D-alanyl-lipoteichoic acid acyltransferase DltB (MBOAT superfamily)|uniref:Probable alginate O-acetylase AlgI n=1 Tax=Methylobacterium longum TaxID=767694 RepID=A0ABT8AP91_9HYPH|nr:MULTISPECIES: MBOAT family O-acyltransferase [Methylobacterium]MCJ2101916.1 hypothetical protein [Methylobacterium sp. E-046]MDN3571609.1 MBOAT family O-acyltransferase [Methylobacterium longum]GJE13973.1 hypothetical protein FOHLNKBM_5042 [Methylobacterium longum]
MNFVSLHFIAFTLVTVLAYQATRSVTARQWVLLIASAYFISTYMLDIKSALPLVAFLGLGYVLIVGMSATPSRVYVAAAVCLMIGSFLYLKQFFFLTAVGLPFIYATVGLSYVLFRIISLIVDLSNQDIDGKPSPAAYLAYTCGFTTFLSGPVQTWTSFKSEYEKPPAPITEGEVLRALSRIATGYFKLAIVAAAFDYLFQNFSVQFGGSAHGLPWFKTVSLYTVSAAAYTGYLYYNFSGYMDIVIGIGGLLQFKLPENFNRPFSAKSFLEFWQRWHMTMSQWFKTYLFTPIMLTTMQRLPDPKHSAAIGLFAFFITFLVMGIWHGSTAVFVVYGVLMAFGACANKLWQIAMPRALGKPGYKSLQKRPVYIQLCKGLTFAFFTLALTCLWTPEIGQLFGLAGRLGLSGLLVSLGALTLCFAAVDTVLAPVAAMEFNALSGLETRYRDAWTVSRCAGVILAVVFVSAILNKAPEFVYKAF